MPTAKRTDHPFSVVETLKTEWNKHMGPEGVLLQIGTLLVSATAEKFKTTTVLFWRVNGIQLTKTATDNLVFTDNDTINTGAALGVFHGGWQVTVDIAGTVVTTPPGGAGGVDMVFTSAAAALAAAKAVPVVSTQVVIGWITVGAKTGADWVANTDDMGAADSSARSFTDATIDVTITGV